MFGTEDEYLGACSKLKRRFEHGEGLRQEYCTQRNGRSYNGRRRSCRRRRRRRRRRLSLTPPSQSTLMRQLMVQQARLPLAGWTDTIQPVDEGAGGRLKLELTLDA